MATTLASGFSLTMKANLVNVLDLQNAGANLALTKNDDLADGTAANQADLAWWDSRTVNAASENIDLAGVLTDAFGNVMTLAKVKGLYVHNKNTTSGHILSLGGAGTDVAFLNWIGDASDIVKVGPDGHIFLWSPADGYAVVTGTADILKIDPGAYTISYDIVIIGTSA